jgi:putative ABC transport system permease protein
MVLTLAFRNLVHDRVRLAVTLIGILFAIVLVAVQLGLYQGARKMIISMIDNAQGEIWITAFGAKSFEEAGLLSGRERHAVLSVPGVKSVTPLTVAFTEWRKPPGGSALIVLVGADPAAGGLKPWNLVQGTPSSLTEPHAVAVDKTYMDNLGVTRISDMAQIEQSRVKVAALTDGIRSFTMAPYVFTSLNRARSMLGLEPNQATFFLVKLDDPATTAAVRNEIKSRLANVDVLTQAEFRDRSLDHWLFGTGAGVALIGGAILGILVGTVIVAQTLYSSTKDHLTEFATLRALGSSAGYIHKVILIQALMSAVLGYGVGMILSLLVIWASKDTTLLIVMTPGLAALLFALTIGMCVIAAISAIFKVTCIDPAGVFSR